jgi:hypothetical protein
MTSAQQPNIEILPGYPADVLAIAAHGYVTRADYEEVLIPAVTAKIAAEGKVKLLYLIGEGFEGFSAGAAWDDAKLGFLHLGALARVAVVTDIDWIRIGTKMFAPLMPCPVHVFHLAEMEAATVWISDNSHEPPHEPGVDVTHKMLLTEDMMPPNP